jgi:hypothetical protein
VLPLRMVPTMKTGRSSVGRRLPEADREGSVGWARDVMIAVDRGKARS